MGSPHKCDVHCNKASSCVNTVITMPPDWYGNVDCDGWAACDGLHVYIPPPLTKESEGYYEFECHGPISCAPATFEIVAFNTSGFPSGGYNRPATLTCDLDFDGPHACDHSTQTICPSGPTTAGPTMSPTEGSAAKDNTGAIVGGVIGGLCGIAIIALIVVFAVRYKNEKAESPYDQVSNVDDEDDL